MNQLQEIAESLHKLGNDVVIDSPSTTVRLIAATQQNTYLEISEIFMKAALEEAENEIHK